MNKILLGLGLVCVFSTVALADISGYQAKGKIVAAIQASPKVTLKDGPWRTRLRGRAGAMFRLFGATNRRLGSLYGTYAAGAINMKTGAVKFVHIGIVR